MGRKMGVGKRKKKEGKGRKDKAKKGMEEERWEERTGKTEAKGGRPTESNANQN